MTRRRPHNQAEADLMPAGWMEVATAADTCQRWRRGTTSWARVEDGGFDPGRYQVVDLPEAAAAGFVAAHHYAASWPAAVHRYGLLDGDSLVGVAVYGVPMSPRVLTGPLPTLVPYRESVELSRLVLLDTVPANAESWLLARTFDRLRGHGVRGVVTFADPMPRSDAGGYPIKRGHIGIVYQAGNAAYCGRSTPRTLALLPDGSVLPARAAQKVRAGEPGAGGVERRLIALGAAPRPRSTTDRARWLADALTQIGAHHVRHPGNHRYVYRLGRGIPLGMPAQPYPKGDPRTHHVLTLGAESDAPGPDPRDALDVLDPRAWAGGDPLTTAHTAEVMTR